jgi:expansin (peptidoglycan-binding protein)
VTEPSPSSHRRLGSFSPRWLAAGGALVLAAVIGVALLLQNGGSACAAPPSTSAKKGKATFFELDGTMGNCSFPNPPANDLFVALGPDQYSAGAACGTYIDVTGPKGKVRVKVIDSCPECEVGHLDLSRTAFKKIADEVEGIVPITYKTVPGASTPGPISVRVKEGSSQYWLAVLIDNHANQLASVKIARSGGSFHTAHREDYNYWIIDSGLGSGPFRIKITDVYGHGATVSGIKLAPGRTQSTTARLSGGSTKVVKAPPPSSHAPSKKKSATPKPAKSSASPSTAPALTSTTATETAAPIEPPVDLAAGAAAACG